MQYIDLEHFLFQNSELPHHPGFYYVEYILSFQLLKFFNYLTSIIIGTIINNNNFKILI